MKTCFVCLLALSVLFSGCMPSKVGMNGQLTSIPQDFTYPVTDNSFLNDAIARHKVDSKKDLIALFTVPAPTHVDLCGLSQDFIKSKFIIDEATSEKIAKKSAKAFLRSGIEGSTKMATDTRDFKILESRCPAPGAPGSVTVRNSTDVESTIGGKITKKHIVSIGILSFGQDLKPTLLAQVTRIDGSDMPPILSYSATGGKYSMGEKALRVSFSKILDKDNINLFETGNNGAATSSTWSNGQLASIAHLKGGKLHGEMIVFPQNVLGTDIPENRICYKKGAVLKTTGPCEVD